jgi:transcription antitermination factor NusG
MDIGAQEGWERGAMKEGDSIRIIRDPFFGRIGRVKALPNELRNIETESPTRVLEAEFSDGSTAVIPRANVELIEE